MLSLPNFIVSMVVCVREHDLEQEFRRALELKNIPSKGKSFTNFLIRVTNIDVSYHYDIINWSQNELPVFIF